MYIFHVQIFQVQGQTFKHPTPVVMDFDRAKDHSQCYVALSRVQELSQVYIVEKLHEDCAGWKVNPSAKSELEKSLKDAINTQPEEGNELEIMCLNVRSLRKHIRHVKQTVRNRNFSILCLQETWLLNNEQREEYQLENFSSHFSSRGFGKGIATYHKDDFYVTDQVCSDDCQFVILTSDKLNVVNVYRSTNCKNFCDLLKPRLSEDHPTLICGDFNTNHLESDNRVSRFLKDKLKYHQIVTKPTHEKGSLLDQVWINAPLLHKVKIEQMCVTYSDHDMIRIVLSKK